VTELPGSLILERSGDAAVLTLNRPERLNAWVPDMQVRYFDLLEQAAADPDVRVIVVTGAGRGFCAGADMEVLQGGDASEDARGDERPQTYPMTIPKPVIAAVNGPAAGGGLALALSSDVRLASPEARFNVAFVKIGVSGADMGTSHLLPRIVGLGHASELMLTGRLVDGEEAARIGLANRVVPADELLDAARELAAEIVANAPFGVRMTKEVLRHNVDAQSAAAAIAMENRTQILAVQTGQIVEAMTAFAEKRQPNWD